MNPVYSSPVSYTRKRRTKDDTFSEATFTVDGTSGSPNGGLFHSPQSPSHYIGRQYVDGNPSFDTTCTVNENSGSPSTNTFNPQIPELSLSEHNQSSSFTEDEIGSSSSTEGDRSEINSSPLAHLSEVSKKYGSPKASRTNPIYGHVCGVKRGNNKHGKQSVRLKVKFTS